MNDDSKDNFKDAFIELAEEELEVRMGRMIKRLAWYHRELLYAGIMDDALRRQLVVGLQDHFLIVGRHEAGVE